MMNKFNPFHLVSESPWPLLSSMQTYSSMMQMTSSYIMKSSIKMNMTQMTTIMLVALMWWKNTSTESNKEGLHYKKTMMGIKMGMVLFILSEVLFFSSFFWGFFHSGISPNMESGMMWPPMGIKSFNPINVPLLNTIILISSGFSITWCHHLMMEKEMKKAKSLLLITIMLGCYFSFLQGMEYLESEFSMTDSTFGTIFFMATGFHGLHVLIGSTFLMVNFINMNKLLLSSKHHMGFEMAAWYWHFVDVVWLFLYLSVYWWSN